MPKYSVHVDRPSFRGFKTSMVVTADNPQAAQKQAEEKYGEGSVFRIVHFPVQKAKVA